MCNFSLAWAAVARPANNVVLKPTNRRGISRGVVRAELVYNWYGKRSIPLIIFRTVPIPAFKPKPPVMVADAPLVHMILTVAPESALTLAVVPAVPCPAFTDLDKVEPKARVPGPMAQTFTTVAVTAKLAVSVAAIAPLVIITTLMAIASLLVFIVFIFNFLIKTLEAKLPDLPLPLNAACLGCARRTCPMPSYRVDTLLVFDDTK